MRTAVSVSDVLAPPQAGSREQEIRTSFDDGTTPLLAGDAESQTHAREGTVQFDLEYGFFLRCCCAAPPICTDVTHSSHLGSLLVPSTALVFLPLKESSGVSCVATFI